MRLIDADALMKKAVVTFYTTNYFSHITKMIDDAPTVEQLVGLETSADPKRGKWRHYEGMLTCTECGAKFYDDIMEYTGDEVPHFCPDCGVQMEVTE